MSANTFPSQRANRLADALDKAPNGTDEDHEEAIYLRYAFPDDCRPGGPIGCASDDFGPAERYLDCVQVRLDQLREARAPYYREARI
jgi:hypothetical protein